MFYFGRWQFYCSLLFLLIIACYFKPFWLLLLGFIFAIFSVSVHYRLFYQQIPLGSDKLQTVLIKGEVERVLSKGYLRIKLTQLDSKVIPWYKSIFANIAVKLDNESLNVGTCFTATAKLKPYRSRKNFDSFDSELYAFTKNLHFKGKLVAFEVSPSRSMTWISSYRTWLWPHLEKYELSWLYYTLLSGDRSKTNYENTQLMQRLGLSHMLAISGLHVGIIYGLCFYMAQWLLFSCALCGCKFNQLYDVNRYYAAIGLLGSAVYVLLSGLSVSALRALLMLIVLVIAYIFEKRVINYRTLLFALCGVLLFDPFSLLNPGLYFSFIAVYSIFTFVRIFIHQLGVERFITQLIILQLILGVVLAPLSSFFFYGVSVSSLLTNIVFIPLLTFALLPALLILLPLLGLGISDSWFLLLDGFFSWLLQLFSNNLLTIGWLPTQPFEFSFLIACYLALLLVMHVKIWRMIACLPLLISAGYALMQPRVHWQLDVFDVGHGTAVLITSQKQAVLYDLGAKYFDRFSIFERVIKPYIERNKIILSHVVLSHQDNDHVGGIDELINFAGKAPLRAFHNEMPDSLCNITRLNFAGALSVESIWPTQMMSSKNNNSCVVKITDGRFSVLLAGDIEYLAEQWLVKQSRKSLQSDILLVPHHGSRTSSSEEFIAAVKPKLAIYSRSYYSIWRLPHSEVVARYTNVDVRQLDTAIDGHIRIKITQQGLLVESARENYHYWFL
ncbi:hypothetical protein PSECIP111951_02285 [Pseudoalteromonas holothuriae]|uniref:Metallo-beta-lactamase domain-containing protein n=1 Tax=Pseudoalteromonas holothuriae TaxID=2963714 RepID=A0ABM9GK39_9GAMM|nr:hypothetical protein PSECIP111951_02285 [Pseudoalteromonas sp. CIP111951]